MSRPSRPTHRDPAARRPLARRPVARPVVALLAAVALAATLPGSAPSFTGAPHRDFTGAPHRDPSGSGAPTGRVAEPGKRLLAAVHRGAGLSAGGAERGRPPEASIRWRRSRALGRPDQGRLTGGVQLPAEGTHFVTVDPVRRASPSPGWRRWGTNRLVRVLLQVAGEHAAANPGAPRLVVGDLSRPKGGRFGPEFGGDGHRSHQNGLDVDVYYPRRDGREKVPGTVAQVDRRLAQELVDRFVRAGAQYVFVGPKTRLHGPAKVVMVLGNHDDHLHVRLHPATRGRR
jgi:murein endopeptidase